MATFSAILVPAGAATNQTVAGTTAGTAVVLGPRTKFAINANQDLNLVFYSTTHTITPSATVGFRVPANATMTFDLSDFYDTIRFFNISGTSTVVSIQPLTVN